MQNVIRAFVREEEGLEMIEWAIVAALLTIASVTALATLGINVGISFGNLDVIITALP